MVDINAKIPAIEKLLDYTASGIGAVAGPIFRPWRAYWEGKAKRISARADADVLSIRANSEAESLPIIATAQADARRYLMSAGTDVRGTAEITRDDVNQRIEFQEQKRLANIRDIVVGAAEVLGDEEVVNHEPDHDWTARIFDYVQDVTSEGLKQIWARILAGEVENPGRTSLRTLSILKDMSQRDAQMFHAMMEYVIDDFILINHCATASGNPKTAEIIALVNMGLVYPRPMVSGTILLNSDGKHEIPHHGHLLIIRGPENTTLHLDDLNEMSHVMLTPQSEELASFFIHKPNLRYLALFAGWLAKRNCELSMAPIDSMDDSGMEHYSQDEVRVIEPAK